MIIKFLLTLGLMACLLYFFVNRAQFRLLALSVLVMILGGIYLVWVPEHATALAHQMGVGRGADLLLYGWVIVSFSVILMLHVRERRILSTLTELVRAIAINHPTLPTKTP